MSRIVTVSKDLLDTPRGHIDKDGEQLAEEEKEEGAADCTHTHTHTLLIIEKTKCNVDIAQRECDAILPM